MHTKIMDTVKGYADNPKGNFDVKALSGQDTYLRLRVGNYRVIFNIENNSLLIHNVDSRENIYKNL